ncbi:MAG: hypothetical protein HY650_00295 [Acidobacteria bacterium]|nr:hypothetical protein [Acidobacteriota bacterium]
MMDELISRSPSDAGLLAMRAHVNEERLDLSAADADWQRYAKLGVDPGEGFLGLADFYHRQVRPLDEVQALSVVAQAPDLPGDRLKPVAERRSWLAFQRQFSGIAANALPSEVARRQYEAWLKRNPKEPKPYMEYFDFLLASEDFPGAEALLVRYQDAFPKETTFPVRARASIAGRRGTPEEALLIYDQAYRPLWPPELIRDYFALLQQQHGLRAFLDHARSALARNPDDFYGPRVRSTITSSPRTSRRPDGF